MDFHGNCLEIIKLAFNWVQRVQMKELTIKYKKCHLNGIAYNGDGTR